MTASPRNTPLSATSLAFLALATLGSMGISDIRLAERPFLHALDFPLLTWDNPSLGLNRFRVLCLFRVLSFSNAPFP